MRSKNNKALVAFFLLQTIWIAGCANSAGGALAPSGTVSSTQNPQVARYTIAPPPGARVTIDFGTDTSYRLQTWGRSAQVPGDTVSILVAGMRANTTYHMRARMELPDGTQQLDSDHTFTTGGLPASRVPQVTVTRPSGLEPNPGIELFDTVQLTSIPPNGRVTASAFDLEGNLIWFDDLQDGAQLDYPFPIKLLPDGNFLMTVAGASYSVREVDLAGDTISKLSLGDINQSLSQAGLPIVLSSLHHDILPLANGHLVLLASQQRTFTDLPGFPGATQVTGDALVDLDEARKPVWVWSTFDHLDLHRQPLGFPDWTHSNALIYSPDDGDLILSVRHQHWVIKIDYRDGRGDGSILWRLGPDGDFTIPNGTLADFNYAQHYPVLIGPARSGVFPLMLFDNGNNRILDSKGTVCSSPGAPTCYSRPVVFQLDETAKTARILWQYELPVFSGCCGNVNLQENGNVEYDIALQSLAPLASRIQEVTMDPVTPQLVWQMDLSQQLAYRAFRIPSLYPGVQWK